MRNDLAEKRDRAFARDYPIPVLLPVRDERAERTKLALTILAVCAAVGIGLVIAGLRWAQGAGWT